jgi:phosphoribosylamine---glycine ligase
MRVLVLGSGGREHALVWKISRSPKVTGLFCIPGNPGMAPIASMPPIAPGDHEALVRFASDEKIDLTVVGPEQPLAAGIVDRFRAAGLAVFGPTRAAAELEWSKAFAKEFMHRHGIPSAEFRVFNSTLLEDARAYVAEHALPVVLKADGLAAGKGVLICTTKEEALAALAEIPAAFGEAGRTIVVEEYMEGEEASVFAITDGQEFVTLAPAQDHKRVFDEDMGRNTGGMGAYAPAPVITEELLTTVRERIIAPTLAGMENEGRLYTGCLYVGLMITSSGPKVVEYNCRFGDPETQVVLPLCGDDLVDFLDASARGNLRTLRGRPLVIDGSAVCVILASGGYPDPYETGKRIRGIETVPKEVVVFHAGTRLSGEELVTSGGRVLGVTAIGGGMSLRDTIARAYEGVRRISFQGMHYRRDIGRKALR